MCDQFGPDSIILEERTTTNSTSVVIPFVFVPSGLVPQPRPRLNSTWLETRRTSEEKKIFTVPPHLNGSEGNNRSSKKLRCKKFKKVKWLRTCTNTFENYETSHSYLTSFLRTIFELRSLERGLDDSVFEVNQHYDRVQTLRVEIREESKKSLLFTTGFFSTLNGLSDLLPKDYPVLDLGRDEWWALPLLLSIVPFPGRMYRPRPDLWLRPMMQIMIVLA